MDPDQVRCFVGLDLGPNCLHRLLADNTSRQRVGGFICLTSILNPLVVGDFMGESSKFPKS